MAGLYFHIPFCRRRCNYCDFYFVTNSNLIKSFTNKLREEIIARAGLIDEPIQTIYFGGGTPSMLAVSQLAEILELAHLYFKIEPQIELTLEANPEDITEKYLQELASVGINRLSLGTQSFNDSKLKILSREHTSEVSRYCIIRSKKFTNNSNIDLIFGTDGETLDDWKRDLDDAIALEPNHISAYSLTVEPFTLLAKLIKRKQMSAPIDSLQSEMYLYTMQRLREAGYEHYEVSNYARTGFESKHNSSYWNRTPYLGFGPSAHSYINLKEKEIRFANVSSLKDYLEHPATSEEFREELTDADIYNETVLLLLRQGKGLGIDVLTKNAKLLASNRIRLLEDYVSAGYVEIKADRVRLTDKGFLLADEIASAFFI